MKMFISSFMYYRYMRRKIQRNGTVHLFINKLLFLFQRMDPISLLVISAAFLADSCYGQAVITFTETNYVVQEGDMFNVQLQKTGTAGSSVNVVVEVMLNSQYSHLFEHF